MLCGNLVFNAKRVYNLALKINPTIIVSTGERSGLEFEMRHPFVLDQQHFYLLLAS
jgi:hypothetical protein